MRKWQFIMSEVLTFSLSLVLAHICRLGRLIFAAIVSAPALFGCDARSLESLTGALHGALHAKAGSEREGKRIYAYCINPWTNGLSLIANYIYISTMRLLAIS